MEVWLDVQSQENGSVPLTGRRLTVGRGEAADVRIADATLSRVHASIHREDDRVWILDEGSANGTYVNGQPVGASGAALAGGDVIRLGDTTQLTVRFVRRPGMPQIAQSDAGLHPAANTQPAERPATEDGLSRRAVVIAAAVVASLLLGMGAWGMHILKARAEERELQEEQARADAERRSPAPPAPSPSAPVVFIPPPTIANTPVLYRQMNEGQKYEFLDRRASHIAYMMSNRSTVFEKEVLETIRPYVESYANRVGTGSTALWGEDLNFMFARATKSAPFIIAAFRKRGVPVVVGLYIPMIESEYRECLPSPAGAIGMFQFMPDTARGYGVVDRADLCRAERMAPVAALYIEDRIREFGTDAMSVALSIAGYNRSPKSVRRDLQTVVDSKNNERTFWTLLANKEELDHWFQKENVKYVPKFFAAAIVGETPEAFGLKTKMLSTYE